MEYEGRAIAEAVEKIVEEKLRKIAKEKKEVGKRKEERLEELKEKVKKMLKEKKEAGKRKEKRREELEEKVRRLERKVERLELNAGKRKRKDEGESETGKRKWWAGTSEGNEDEQRKRNVILRVEKEKWGGKRSNWEKVKELFAEGLKVRVTVREVIVVGQREIWLTILVKLGDEE
ncbi:UPF0329 protein ECU05_1680/ECU11_0050-like [Temnothorax curvispinosus]|uniref:UPF0329 protein ECU05_1680/ECU11_0050-like n=1 Tax=Temnothorax curvispinosus TaxID=300111 RepID=A0A6J1R2P1_9HYME|nr:UPF0329 protein ECU05_1680/ECU11_0050-like [Temnothorax curvispinosus]